MNALSELARKDSEFDKNMKEFGKTMDRFDKTIKVLGADIKNSEGTLISCMKLSPIKLRVLAISEDFSEVTPSPWLNRQSRIHWTKNLTLNA